MYEVIFLLGLALVWIVFATMQDLRQREVADWLNFSLILFALGFRLFYGLFSEAGFELFYQGLIGLGIFFVVGNLFYYGRIFAGGDAKLMIALGTILPLSENFIINIKLYLLYLALFLFVGAFYGLGVTLFLAIKNSKSFKKEFAKRFKLNKKLVYLVMLLGLVVMVLGFIQGLLLVLGVLIFILPYLYLFAKSVDECCMVKRLKPSELTEGDWLYKAVKVGNKKIEVDWDGLDKEDIKLIKRYHKSVEIRQGVAYVPVFLISFLIFIYMFYSGNLDFFRGFF
jgi:Flp pilus assembly protein protease CpaA